MDPIFGGKEGNKLKLKQLKKTKKKQMDEVQGQEDEVINPDIEVFISYFENLNIDYKFNNYEEFTSENYGNINVSLTLEDTISQSQSISQEEIVAK